jgi:hypothetical protein
VGGGVIKGASFLGRGIISRFRNDDASISEADEIAGDAAAPSVVVEGSPAPSETANGNGLQHSRTRSVASHYGDRMGLGGAGKGESGTATITVVSASDYPPSANVRVYVKAITPKGEKEVLKSKAHKASGGGPVQFDASHETCRVHNTTADVQYRVRVVDHATFGSDSVLGEGMFMVADQGSGLGQDKAVQAGSGTVTIRSSFAATETSLRPGTAHSTAGDGASEVVDSPESKKGRRSFLSKRSVSGA